MILARVIGMVTSSDKDPELGAYKLLVVVPLGLDLEAEGEETIAIDRVGAGIGERVLVVREGNAARQITGRDKIPLQNVIVGVVDDVNWLEGRAPAGRQERG